MPRPPTFLRDLAAGRPLEHPTPLGLTAIRSAKEHRVHGLLAGAENVDLDPLAAQELEMEVARTWAAIQRLDHRAYELQTIADHLRIDIAFIKGISVARRWYGENWMRPYSDLDVLVAPWHRDRTAEFIAALQPGHSILAELPDLLNRDRVQSVDLDFKGVPVDLHLDPLKLEIATSLCPEAFWEESAELLDGEIAVRVLSDEACLLLAAVHLAKDRFRFLIGYSDVRRIATTPTLNWGRFGALARREQLVGVLGFVFDSVEEDLSIQLPLGGERHRSRRHSWGLLWPSSSRLLGQDSLVRFRYRQFAIGATSPRRFRGLIASLARRVLPSRALLHRQFPNVEGPYLVALLRGRLAIRLDRRKRRKQLISDRR